MNALKLEPQFMLIEQTVAELASEPSTREVWLFGSRANGTAAEESDWDILVFVREDPLPVAARRLEAKIDILRVGPSGRALLDGEPEELGFDFADFSWSPVSGGCASYVGKKPNACVELQARDANIPIFRRPHLKAWLLWPTSQRT